jgi:hypothetical protein
MNGSTSFNEDLINFFNQAEIRDQNVGNKISYLNYPLS